HNPASAEVQAADGAGGQRIQAVDRAMALLKWVATSTTPPTALELARASGINRSTAWRLLRTLEYQGLVDRDPLTPRDLDGVCAGETGEGVVGMVGRVLEDLAAGTQESVMLAVAKRFNLVYVDQVDPPSVMAPSWLQKPLPLHATSGGKVFLAWLRRDERDAILPRDLPRYTGHTVTDREPLEREFDAVRRTGYALCTREYEEFSSGASAAVLNSRQYPIAVVNVWGPAPRNPVKRLHEIGREAVKTADEVRNLL